MLNRLNQSSWLGDYGISTVIATYNSASHIENTLIYLDQILPIDSEIVIVENGSTDGTYEVIEEFRNRASLQSTLIILRSNKGLGNALSKGVMQARKGIVWITGDDLPFGSSEFDSLIKIEKQSIYFGSKSHPDSKYIRSVLRRATTICFRKIRNITFNFEFGDTQGSIIGLRQDMQSLVRECRESGFLWTTEIALLAYKFNYRLIELRIEGQDEGNSRVKISDVLDMFFGLLRLKKRHMSVINIAIND